MIAVLQRVTRAQVDVAGDSIAKINAGLLVFVAVLADDVPAHAQRMAERLLGYRVFADPSGRMNLSLSDTGGGLLLVPQFTLAADTRRGQRPSFSRSAPPDLASEMFDTLVAAASARHAPVAQGRFGADMQVALVNDGPVTFWLES